VIDAARRTASEDHTRFPLCSPEAGLDDPVGLVHAKDLLAAALERPDAGVQEVARALARVPDGMLIDELLTELRERRAHLAVVVDEYETVVGLVTLEDVLEELVGEIADEFDRPEEEGIVREPNGARVPGSASLRAVREELGIVIAAAHEATIGGHVMELLGRVPEVGEEVRLDGHVAEVTAVGEAHITEPRFELPGLRPADDADREDRLPERSARAAQGDDAAGRRSG
jgi:CBS domain containing-hemolysin-like protein